MIVFSYLPTSKQHLSSLNSAWSLESFSVRALLFALALRDYYLVGGVGERKISVFFSKGFVKTNSSPPVSTAYP